MSVVGKVAVLGLAGIGAAIGAAGMSAPASADRIRNTCHGQVTIGDNLIVDPGDRGRGRVALNDRGWVRWYCDNGDGRVAHRQDCIDDRNEAMVEVRLLIDGGLRITCN